MEILDRLLAALVDGLQGVAAANVAAAVVRNRDTNDTEQAADIYREVRQKMFKPLPKRL